MGNATARRDNYSSSASELTQNNFLTDSEVRAEFSTLVLPFSKHQLAKLGNVSAQAADLWHKEERTPSTASVLNLARALPSVRDWLVERSGYSRSAQAGSLDEIIRALHAIAARDDAEGRIAEQLIALAASLRRTTTVTNAADNVIRDLFDRGRQ